MPPKSTTTRRKTKTPAADVQSVFHMDPVPEAVNEPPANDITQSIGERLRSRRESLNLTIENVSQMLKIRRVYLQAIEESNWAELPEPVYVNGFIRSYAAFLGMDVEPGIKEQSHVTVQQLPAALPALVMPKPMDDQQLPKPGMVIAAAVALFFLYALWMAIESDGKQPPVQPLQNTDAESTAPAISTPVPTLLNAPPLVQETDSSPPPKPAQTPPAVEKIEMPEEKVTSTYGASDNVRAVVRATTDSWIQVRDRSDAVVFSGILRAGDSYRVPADQPLFLSTTNLAGLQFELDGQAATPPNADANTLAKSLPLSVDNFLGIPKKTETSKSAAPKPDTPAPKPKAVKKHTPPAEEDSVSDSSNDNEKYKYPSER